MLQISSAGPSPPTRSRDGASPVFFTNYRIFGPDAYISAFGRLLPSSSWLNLKTWTCETTARLDAVPRWYRSALISAGSEEMLQDKGNLRTASRGSICLRCRQGHEPTNRQKRMAIQLDMAIEVDGLPNRFDAHSWFTRTMMARRDTSSADPAVRALKNLVPDPGAAVEVPVVDLHEADGNIEYAIGYLADFIGRKMEEHGFETLDDANERSPDLSELLFLLGVIEDAGFVMQRHVTRTLTGGDLLPQ